MERSAPSVSFPAVLSRDIVLPGTKDFCTSVRRISAFVITKLLTQVPYLLERSSLPCHLQLVHQLRVLLQQGLRSWVFFVLRIESSLGTRHNRGEKVCDKREIGRLVIGSFQDGLVEKS